MNVAPPRPPRRGRRATAVGVALVAASAGLLGAGVVLAASGAMAAFESLAETGAPGLLRLSADDRAPLWSTLSPGEETRWLIRADLDDADRGDLELELRADGELAWPDGLTVAISACSGEFGDPSPPAEPPCAGVLTTVLATTPLAEVASALDAEGDRFDLGVIRRDGPRQIVVALALPENAAPNGARTRVLLGVHAAGNGQGDDEGQNELAVTGADVAALALLAAGLISVGAGATALRSARRAR